jgi:hypothetical protein
MNKFYFSAASAALWILFAAPLLIAQTSEKQIRRHISYLASDKLEGRGTGTKGEQLAADYVAKWFSRYKLKPKGDNGTWLHAFTFRERSDNPHALNDTTTPLVESKNVVGYLDNGAPFTVVIGAHYDHLGRGERVGSLDVAAKGKVHNGADDNASGVAGLLEIARHYATDKNTEKYNILFIAFSGEELGLFGSKAFCERPTIDLKTVHIMLNLDMVGRLDTAAKKLAVSGTGTCSPIQGIVLALQTSELTVKTDSAGMGPSDHTSFYQKDIPVLHFFTGTHTDYHKPSDDAEKINYAGEKQVLDYIISVADSCMTLQKFQFTPTRNNSATNAPRFKVTLGIMPDYMFDGEGVKIDGVTEGKPAQKAGILKDDILLKLDEMPTKTVMEYMKALSVFEKGNKAKVTLKRKDEIKEIEITF